MEYFPIKVLLVFGFKDTSFKILFYFLWIYLDPDVELLEYMIILALNFGKSSILFSAAESLVGLLGGRWEKWGDVDQSAQGQDG